MIYRYSEYSSHVFPKFGASPPPPDTQYCCSQVPGLFAEVFPEQSLQKTKYLPPSQEIRESKSTRIAAILNHSFFPSSVCDSICCLWRKKLCVFDQQKPPQGVWVFSPHPDLAPSRNPVTHVLKRWPWGSKMQTAAATIWTTEKMAHLKTQDMVSVVTFLSDHQNEKTSILQLTYTIHHKFHVLPPNKCPPVLIPRTSINLPPQALSLLRLIPDGSLKERMLQSLKRSPNEGTCNNRN